MSKIKSLIKKPLFLVSTSILTFALLVTAFLLYRNPDSGIFTSNRLKSATSTTDSSLQTITFTAPPGHRIEYIEIAIAESSYIRRTYKTVEHAQVQDNIITVQAPRNGFASLQVLAFKSAATSPEWREWYVNLGNSNRFTWGAPGFISYPNESTGKVPVMVVAWDEHIYFSANKYTEAISLTGYLFDGEKVTITPEDQPHFRPTSFIPPYGAADMTGGFYFDFDIVQPHKIAKYELKVRDIRSKKRVIETYTYTTSVKYPGLFIKQPEVLDVKEYALFFDGDIDPAYGKNPQMYFVSWTRYATAQYTPFEYLDPLNSESKTLSIGHGLGASLSQGLNMGGTANSLFMNPVVRDDPIPGPIPGPEPLKTR